MALLTHQVIDEDGADLTLVAAAAGGDTYLLEDNESFLVVRNADAAAKTVTLVTPGTVGGLAVADRAVSVAAGAFALIPLDKTLYRNTADGLMSITYSAVTSVTVAVARFG